MSKSISLRTVSELQEDEAVIDLTDPNTVLHFANSITNLGSTRRQTVWVQNVQTNNIIQSETNTPEQMDDILLYLIIIHAKEQYPEQDDELISKLKEFVNTGPFNNLQKYLQEKYFPLLQTEFINNNSYFASMIEDYAHHELITKPYDYTRNISHFGYFPLSRASTPSTFNLEDVVCAKLEEKIMDLFAVRLSKIEYKLETISKEVQLMKYAMIEDTKQPNNDGDRLDDIMNEMENMKHEIVKISTIQKHRLHKKKSKKRLRLKLKRKSTDEGSVKKCDETGHGGKDLKRWLEDEVGLSEYLNLFMDNGLCQLSMMKHVTMNDLVLIGIKILGDRVKIMQKIQKLKYEMQR